MKGVYRSSTLVFGCLSIVLGLAILVQTLRHGAGVGVVIGVLFIGLGIGRIYLLLRR